MKHSVPTSQDLEGCGLGRVPNHEARRPSAAAAAAAAAASTTQNRVHAHINATVPRTTNRTMSQNRSFHQEPIQSWRNIPKSSRLPSYAAAAALRRQQEEEEETQRYAQDPPTEMELIQLRMVLPQGLDVTRPLDGICRTKRVWITRPSKDAIDMHAESMKALREALEDVNWATHYASESQRTSVRKVLAQAPIQASDQARISLLALRPQVRDPVNSSPSLTAAASYTAASLASEFIAGTDAVLGSTKELDMKISFGHLRLLRAQFRNSRSMSYKDLGRFLRICSQRGDGASDFEARFTEPFRAEMLLRHMLDEKSGVCDFSELARDACSLNFEADGLVLSADVVGPATIQPQLAGIRVIKTEPRCRLGVIMATPDMKHDWSLEVRTSDHKDVPDDLEKMVMKLKLRPARREQAHEVLRQPSVLPFNLGDFGRKVTETRLRTSAIVPWKSTSYLFEIGVTTAWKGADMRSKSRMYWDVQFYGNHWESAINRAKPGGQRKDWGNGLGEVWPGEAESLTDRFGEFVKELLDLQVMLETSH